MGPSNQFATVQDAVALSSYVIWLFKKALPDPADRSLFDRLMYQAKAKGLDWVQGLEYVVQQRHGVCR